MWTKQTDVINYANAYLGDVTVNDIKQFAKNLKLEITKEEILAWLQLTAKANGVDMVAKPELIENKKLSDLDNFMLLKVAREIAAAEERKKYQLDEKVYDLNAKKLKIYRQKCLSLCNILQILSMPEIDSAITIQLDITIKDGKILTADLDRLLKPLKKNYLLAKELKEHVESCDSYLKDFDGSLVKSKKDMPTSSLINHSKKPNDECVEMTERLRSEYKEKHDKILRNALGLNHQY